MQIVNKRKEAKESFICIIKREKFVVVLLWPK